MCNTVKPSERCCSGCLHALLLGGLNIRKKLNTVGKHCGAANCTISCHQNMLKRRCCIATSAYRISRHTSGVQLNKRCSLLHFSKAVLEVLLERPLAVGIASPGTDVKDNQLGLLQLALCLVLLSLCLTAANTSVRSIPLSQILSVSKCIVWALHDSLLYCSQWKRGVPGSANSPSVCLIAVSHQGALAGHNLCSLQLRQEWDMSLLVEHVSLTEQDHCKGQAQYCNRIGRQIQELSKNI